MKTSRPRGRPATPETQIQEGWLDGAKRRFLSHGLAHGSPALKDLLARCKKLERQSRPPNDNIQGVAREWATLPGNWPSGYRVEGTWLEKFAALALRAYQSGYAAHEKELLLIPWDFDRALEPLPPYTFKFADRHWTPRFITRIMRGMPRAGKEIYYEARHSLDEFAENVRSEFNDALNAFLESARSLESKRLRLLTAEKLPSTLKEDLELAARYYLCNETAEDLAEEIDSSTVRRRVGRVLRLLELEPRKPGRPRKKPRK